jgi:starch phosphorylase
MDKPRFARKSAPAKTNHTDAGDLSIRPAIAPAENGDLDEIKSAVLAKLALDLGKDASVATDRDWFVAAALTIRDRVVHRWLAVNRASHAQGRKRVYYLSLEFLIGRLFADVLCNLGWTEIFRAALGDLGVDLNRLRAAEPDAALGHGGLGRLAACFMESMATLGIPAYGYGIRYDSFRWSFRSPAR